MMHESSPPEGSKDCINVTFVDVKSSKFVDIVVPWNLVDHNCVYLPPSVVDYPALESNVNEVGFDLKYAMKKRIRLITIWLLK